MYKIVAPTVNEKVTIKQWIGVVLGFTGAAVVLGFDIGEELPLIGVIAARCEEMKNSRTFLITGELPL